MSGGKLNRQQEAGIVRFLVDTCIHRNALGESGKMYCALKYKQKCTRNGNMWIDYLECPHDCPHHPDNVHILCDGARCANIKRQLKNISNYIDAELCEAQR